MTDSHRLIIVTGSSGFIGKAVCDAFMKDGFKIVGFDRPESGSPPSGIDFVRCDVTSDESVASAISRVRDAFGDRVASIVHLAAYYDFSGEPSSLYDEVTVRGTERLLRAVRQLQVEQFVFSSTMLVHAPCRPGEHIDENSPLDPKWEYPDSKLHRDPYKRRLYKLSVGIELKLFGSQIADANWSRAGVVSNESRVVLRCTTHHAPASPSTTDAMVVTSAPRCCESHSCRFVSRPSRPLAIKPTCAPRRPYARARARPTPADAPVMTTT
ncbi:MAG: NAD(P)-dependent oxidoreductase [Acidobacteria bacterium]|nr:MAG: NAD(P)-dependent oxidoreductase [Acidobacteriota bacterium]